MRFSPAEVAKAARRLLAPDTAANAADRELVARYALACAEGPIVAVRTEPMPCDEHGRPSSDERTEVYLVRRDPEMPE